jgi:hypothetical protein
MMNMVTAAFVKLAAPLVALVILLALTVVSLVYAIKGSSIGLYITASMLIGFSTIPAMLIYDWFRLNKRVLIRDNNLEVRYHASYKTRPLGLFSFVSLYPFERVMEALEAEISAQPELVINKGFDRTNLIIEFCPLDALQDPHRNGTKKVGGLQYGNKIMVVWKPEDVTFTKSIITHELGHVLIWLNHPTMSTAKHHEILAKCHL